jgi:non-heme chloroperoxidase
MKSSLLLITLLSISVTAFAQNKVHKVNTIDGLDLEVQEWGNPNGKEIVFIHGMGQSYLAWMKQTASEALKDYRIITYDLRGHGNSDKPNVATLYSDGKKWGEDLDTVIRDSKLKKPIVVGWSLGGYIISNYLSIYGDKKISGIVFVDAVMKMKPEYFTKDNMSFIAPLSATDLQVRALGIRNFLRACFKIQPTAEEFEFMLIYNAMVPRVVHLGLGELTGVNSDKILKTVKVPTLIITGKQDQLISPAMAKYTQGQIKHAKLEIFDKSGHTPFFEEADRFNLALKTFADQIK